MLIALLPPTISNPSAGTAQIDHATAEWAGVTYSAESRSGIVPAMARELIAAGCPDQPWQAARAGRVVMFGPSLARAAALTVSDTDNGAGPRFVKYTTHHLARTATCKEAA